MSWTVSHAEPDEAWVLASLEIASWQASYAEQLDASWLDELDPSKLARRWRERLFKARFDEDRVWLLKHEGQALGFCWTGDAAPDEAGFCAEVFMLYLHPEITGKGLGTALWEVVLEDLRGRGYPWLQVWVLESHDRARRFYERLGLRFEGSTRTDTVGPDQVEVVRYDMPLDTLVDFRAGEE